MLLKRVLRSQTFTINFWFWYIYLCIFRDGLMMIPSESKHVAQGQ